MSMKRLLPAENDDLPPRERKRPTLLSVGREVIKLQLMQRLLVPIFEPVLRRVVQEELERAFLKFIPSVHRPSINQIQAPEAIGPQLHFNSRLSDTLFTGSKISHVQVVIHSGNSEEPIATGPLSSRKVEIVVLDGDFGRDGNVDWAKGDFDASVVRERADRGPLLKGDLIIALREGVGTFGNITFTDNSSWIRSRRFRLGVRIVQRSGTEERIRESRSEPFVVKDRRGESNRKYDSPSLGDAIWRLKNIGKDGVLHKRLTDNGIETVQQFLRFLVTDLARLRSMLGPGMTNKAWQETVRNAQKCVLDRKSYMYFSAEQVVGLLLNSIYEVKNVTFDGYQSFQSIDDLIPYQKELVENLKQQAYRNQEGIVEFNGLPLFGPSRPLPELLLQPASIPETSFSLQNPGLITHQMPDFLHSTNPSSQLQLMVDLPQLKDAPFMPDVLLRQMSAPMQSNSSNMLVADQPQLESTATPQDHQLSQLFSPIHSNTFDMAGLFHMPYGDSGDRWPASGSGGSVTPNMHLLGEYPQVQMLNWFNRSVQFPSDEMGARATSFLNNSPLPNCSYRSPGIVQPKGWRKLGAPLKWRILVGKHVAAKRMAEYCT